MEKSSQKPQTYPWICRGFLRTLDPQKIGADQEKIAQFSFNLFDIACKVTAVKKIKRLSTHLN
jgi:hypothetical protein